MEQSKRTVMIKKAPSLLMLVGLILAMLLASVAPTLAQGRTAQYGPPPGPPPGEEYATYSFELAVECEPPANAELLGLTATEGLVTTPLVDPDSDGLYTGSITVPQFPPGPRPVPPDMEPVSLPVRIVQGPPTGYSAMGPEYRVIKDFGVVKAQNSTFTASVSFCNGGASDQYSGAGAYTDTVSGDTGTEINVLPDTGGALPIALGTGALLLSGGLLIRRLAR